MSKERGDWPRISSKTMSNGREKVNIIQSTDYCLMIQHDKENLELSSNRQTAQHVSSKARLEVGESSKMPKLPQTGRREILDDVRMQLYGQHRKNREIYARITEKNPHFSYQLHRRSTHSHLEHALIRQHELLLQEEAFLLKELAKIEQIGHITHTQKDPFGFLLEVWERDRAEVHSAEDRVDELSKRISFLKVNVKECASKLTENYQIQFSSKMISESKEYRELSQKYDASLKQIQALQEDIKLKTLSYEQRMDRLESHNQEMKNLNRDLQSKLQVYQQKSQQIASKTISLTNQLANTQKKLQEALIGFTKKYESLERLQNRPQFQLFLKDNTQFPRKTAHMSLPSAVINITLQEIINFVENSKEQLEENRSLAHSSVLSQVSFESIELDDKQNSFNEEINDIGFHSNPILPYSSISSIKKLKNTNRQVLFSQCKNRSNLFPNNESQQNLSKPIRFIRRK